MPRPMTTSWLTSVRLLGVAFGLALFFVTGGGNVFLIGELPRDLVLTVGGGSGAVRTVFGTGSTTVSSATGCGISSIALS